MTLKEYEQEFFPNLANGTARRNGIRKAIDAALEKQDAEGALALYHAFMHEDTFYCDNLQSTLVFPEYLAYFEAHEELQDKFQHDVMWSYKWIIGNFYEFHQISMRQIEQIFEQYAAFCRKFNYSLRTYYEFLCSFIQVSLNPGESFRGVTAKEAFTRMMKAKKDDLSDCKACELNREMLYYLKVENNPEKALEVIKPVLAGRLSCAEIPEMTYDDLANYYFTHSDLKNALKYAMKSYRLIRRQRNSSGAYFRTLSDIALITAYREPEKALKMIRDILPYIADNRNSTDCYTFFHSMYNVMLMLEKEGYHNVMLKLPFREEAVYSSDNHYSISDIRDFAYQKASFYAEKLDARNGNTLLMDNLNNAHEFKSRFRKPSKLDIPVLEYLDEYLDEGKLPPNFSLPKKKPPKGEPEFIDGARDGILFFHTEPYRDELGELEEYIRLAGKGKVKLAARKVEKYFSETEKQMLPLVDNMQNFIIEHKDELDLNEIYSFGIELTVGAKNYEAVKMGLSVLEIFSDYNDNLLEAIMKLSSSDEFTLFCIWAVRNLENSNKLIWEMAKNTIGWGKIFAVQNLKCETDEIKKWLLYYGVQNVVHPGYLAIKCFEEANVRELLHEEPDISQMQAIAYIILFLLEDGPTIGINVFDDKDEIIDSFLENAERLGYEDADDENYPKIVQFVQEYRDAPDNDENEDQEE